MDPNPHLPHHSPGCDLKKFQNDTQASTYIYDVIPHLKNKFILLANNHDFSNIHIIQNDLKANANDLFLMARNIRLYL